MHRFLVDTEEGKVVDHIDHNPSNNSKVNLRICLIKENVRNTIMYSHNTSGYKGVTKGRRNKWVAQIQFNKKAIYLGEYELIEDAIYARYVADKILFKNFSCCEIDVLPINKKKIRNKIIRKLEEKGIIE